MKKWIKLETNLLQDERISKMMENYGAKGLGVYLIIRLLSDCLEGCGRYIVLCLAGKLARRRMVENIIQDFGLFVIDKYDVVRPCFPAYVPAYAFISARIDAPADMPAEAHTPDHIISLNKYIDIDVDILRERRCNYLNNNHPYRESFSNVRKIHTMSYTSSRLAKLSPVNPVTEKRKCNSLCHRHLSKV